MPTVGGLGENNAPITVIDAHKSIHTGSPYAAQLAQSVELLNSLLLRLIEQGPAPSRFIVPPLMSLGFNPPLGYPSGVEFPGFGMDPPAIILKDPQDPRRDAQIFAET
jgi:hypothetical protein